MMRQAGFSQEKFDACLKDQKLYDAVNDVKNRGTEHFKRRGHADLLRQRQA